MAIKDETALKNDIFEKWMLDFKKSLFQLG